MIKLIRFYFVHRKRVYPKPYYAVLESTLNQQYKPGTVAKYGAFTRDGTRWQTIVVTDVYDVDYRPRFEAIKAKQIYRKHFNQQELRSWKAFSKDHGYENLVINERGDNDEK